MRSSATVHIAERWSTDDRHRATATRLPLSLAIRLSLVFRSFSFEWLPKIVRAVHLTYSDPLARNFKR
jgi:hypothetical protein